MPAIFCPSCYHKNEYSSKPGRFCSECGASFLESTAAIPTQKPTPQKPLPRKIRTPKTLKNVVAERFDEDEILDDDEIDNIEIPQIEKIEIEPTSYRPNTEKFGQVAGSGKTGEVRPRTKGGKSPSKKSIENNWKEMFPNKRKSVSIGPEE